MLRRIATVVTRALCVAGCANREMVSFRVESDPSGAPVEVDDVSFGTTPTTIQLGAGKRWVGVMNSPDGWQYDRDTYAVTVFAPRGFRGLAD